MIYNIHVEFYFIFWFLFWRQDFISIECKCFFFFFCKKQNKMCSSALSTCQITSSFPVFFLPSFAHQAVILVGVRIFCHLEAIYCVCTIHHSRTRTCTYLALCNCICTVSYKINTKSSLFRRPRFALVNFNLSYLVYVIFKR